MRRSSKIIAAVVGVVALGTGAGVALASTDHSPNPNKIGQIRDITDSYRDVTNAEQAGYGLFLDKQGIDCIDMPGMGGMGVHYVNGDFVGDGKIDLKKPEAMVYAKGEDGSLTLAAVEYIVDKRTWDKTHNKAPELFPGQPFNSIPDGNRFGIPSFYAQHVWAWKFNPAGELAMWNPDVVCP